MINEVITTVNYKLISSIFRQIIDNGEEKITHIDLLTCLFSFIKVLVGGCNAQLEGSDEKDLVMGIKAIEELTTDVLSGCMSILESRDMISKLISYPIFDKIEIKNQKEEE